MEPDFEDTSFLLVCPQCDADVAYEDVEEAELSDHVRCPICDCASPVNEWLG